MSRSDLTRALATATGEVKDGMGNALVVPPIELVWPPGPATLTKATDGGANYTFGSGDGSSKESAIVVRTKEAGQDATAFAVGRNVDLSGLVTRAAGSLSYEVSPGGGTISGTTLTKSGGAGTVVVKVTDAGSVSAEGRELYFSLTFKAASTFGKQGTASNLVAASGLASRGGASSSDPLVVSGAAAGTTIDLEAWCKTQPVP